MDKIERSLIKLAILNTLSRTWNRIAALWRIHHYDYDDCEYIPPGGSIDADITGEEKIYINFIAHCKYCGKGIRVDRANYGKPTIRQLLFCVRDPQIHKQWKDRQKERAQELHKMGATSRDLELAELFFEEINETDKRSQK